MKISFSVIILIVLGLVAATAAAMFTATLSAGNIGNVLNADVPDITVLVAAEDIPMMTPIRAEDIVEKKMQPSVAPQNHFTNPTQIIGKRIIGEMISGQAFTRASFPSEGTGVQLASQIPAGKRAVNIEVAEYERLAGLLYPGAVVDVLASFRVSNSRMDGKALATTLLQNIQVLAVGNEIVGDNSALKTEQEGKGNASPKPRPFVTLLVNTDQAKALQLAMKFGQISLTLRNPSDEIAQDEEATMLSDGLLMELATLLGSTVSGEEDSGDGANIQRNPVKVAPMIEIAEEIAPPLQRPEKKARKMRVNVLRGLNSESHEFSQQN